MSIRICLLLLFLTPAPVCMAGIGDMQQVKRSILELNATAPEETVRQYIESQQPDGSWEDIRYQDTLRSQWGPSFHAGRLTAMATAYKDKNSVFYKKRDVAGKIHRGMKYWDEGKFVCRNWWYNQIGVPRILGVLYLLMEDEMSKSEMTAAIRYMENAKFGMTGQNSVWLAENVLVRALLEKNEPLLMEARDYIVRELVVSPDGEGIRPDMSFHQHGPQQQFGNYGLAYAGTQAYWARIFKSTVYEVSREQLDILHHYLVDGLQWTCWKGYMDIGSCGRQVVPNAQESKARSYGASLKHAMAANPEKADEYGQILKRDIEPSTAGNNLTGYRFFNYSDYGLYRTATWSAGLKMSSTRTVGSEIINYENLLGRFLCNGGIFFYREGSEYEDIFPVWDWTRVPGITCLLTDSLFPGVVMGRYYTNRHDFVGGLSGDRAGVAAIVVDNAGLQAKKSYFFTDRAIVCTGSGIRGDGVHEITTSIEQKLQKGDISVTRKAEGQVICHDRMAYYVPDDPSLRIQSGKATGNWQRIASVNPPDPVEKEVFGLWIDHGAEAESASYCYLVFPDASAGDAIDSAGIKIIQRDEKAHALQYKNIFQSVFFQSASVPLGPDETVSVLTPCLLMIETEGNKRTLSLCDPTWHESRIELKLTGNWSGQNCRYDKPANQTHLTLPASDTKGATIRCTLTRQ
ncbi:MAG: polysaccharide lyase beta-sandwich domain-containing protein [Tannerella sp.]|jgi:chondroitin AC lyase|nr:polysaccharide lyase beta-sandwich domain-containing protein [Tannerella sp.]